ncbi:uncharacterized protein sb:cb288 isoform X2 [Entelurus aequoreus]|uniref:uncharacterized protein sb:cb288 isoform X2 n=1 Tax=Entelurus aequoreus TaxID=161455 RepID=UPI002B1D8062|nr:uncharacterized protein sb:cb288 isoform X2 [Entelurus aequoreus]
MWTKALHSSNFNNSSTNTSKMVDPDLTWQTLQVLQKNGSTAAAARPSSRDDALDTSNGIIPGAIAAALFIAMLLGLYAVLWKCMVSPPQRKRRKVRARVHQRTSV